MASDVLTTEPSRIRSWLLKSYMREFAVTCMNCDTDWLAGSLQERVWLHMTDEQRTTFYTCLHQGRPLTCAKCQSKKKEPT